MITIKKITSLLFITLIIFSSALAQQKLKDKYKDRDAYPLEKTFAIIDRAGGTHNASNIGLFFENRGKLYPRRISQGPSGEFPINSGKHYIYRLNAMVGIPGNVVQGRYTDDEEWEAVGGYHNTDSAKIAFSDDPNTWDPKLGWPIKDANGNPVIKSDQDSYCVYSDSNNTVEKLGILIAQTGYAYGVKFARNIIFFKFDVINIGNKNLKDVYFDLYQDCDIGNISGGAAEYTDDRVGFDKVRNLTYFYDKGVSSEWPGGKTGFMGFAFLKTPTVNGVELGVTDMHYNIYDDDFDIDSVQYGIMASTPGLYKSSLGGKYFHLGSNTSLHYDDPSTIPESGLDILANSASGPYELNPGDTLTFITAIVAGETLQEMLSFCDQAQNTINANFELPKPPVRPTLSGTAGDSKAILFWNDASEKSIDNFTGNLDFEGYRIYRSNDNGKSWNEIADFDIVNSVGSNTGLQYSYTDTTVINGFDYWYSITAYDRGDEQIESLESSIGNNLDAINTVSVIPRSSAIGRSPVSAVDAIHYGSGSSNFILNVNPTDNEALKGNEYKIGFTYISKKEAGDLETKVNISITDSSKTKPYKYAVKFLTASSYDLLNLTTGELIGRTGTGYPNGGRTIDISTDGIKIIMEDDVNAPPEKRPEQGDIVTINFAAYAVSNNQDTVLYPRPVSVEQAQATSDGVIFSLITPNLIKGVSRVGGSDNVNINFSVSDQSLVTNDMYLVSIDGNGFNAANEGFVNLSVKNSASEIILTADSLLNQSTFAFNGIEGEIEFPSSAPPNAGNIFSVEVEKPVLPGIQDKYKFTIQGSSVNIEEAKQEMNKIKVVPNPYVVSSLYEKEFGELRREPLRQIQFINLPPECTIYIFTADADRVKTIYHNSQGGTETWDLRTESGREIAPGVYLYVVEANGKKYIERFAVIK